MAELTTRTEHTATISTDGIVISRTVVVHDGARLVAAIHLDPIRLCDAAQIGTDFDLQDAALAELGWRRVGDDGYWLDLIEETITVDVEPIPDPRAAARARVAAYLTARDASDNIRDSLPAIDYVAAPDNACGGETALLAADLRTALDL